MAERNATTELKDDIVFTVTPLENGCVGVKTPTPSATFEVTDPNVINIGPTSATGGLAALWRNYKGNTTNNAGSINDNINQGAGWGVPQFYREGSRVYMDGMIEFAGAGTYTVGMSTPIMTLPLNYRPVKAVTFVVAVSMSRQIGSPVERFTQGQLWIARDGKVYLFSVSGNAWENGTQMQSSTASSGFINGTGTMSQNIGLEDVYISFSGVDFRTSGFY
jgi:hypothetical protein